MSLFKHIFIRKEDNHMPSLLQNTAPILHCMVRVLHMLERMTRMHKVVSLVFDTFKQHSIAVFKIPGSYLSHKRIEFSIIINSVVTAPDINTVTHKIGRRKPTIKISSHYRFS